MIKYLVALIILTSQVDASIVKMDKRSLLQLAKNHKEQAIWEMYYLQDDCKYMPDFGSKENMKVFIASTIGAVCVPGIRAKIVSVGLALIGGVAVNYYERYEEMRGRILRCAYHTDQYQFYSIVSTTIGLDGMIQEQGSKDYLLAIDSLTLAEVMCDAITDEHVKYHMRRTISGLRDGMIKMLTNDFGKLDVEFMDDLETFEENCYEILAEYDDNIKDELIMFIVSAVESIGAAQKTWGN